ncbi:hypothetical protein GJ496_000586 [Pomphorhynchus laevis]|nr:hypothetical protein GJ496_000586 [Pomphorhynchus laevis]
MKNGRTTQAMRILDKCDSIGGVFPLESQIGNKTVEEILIEKHPIALMHHQSALLVITYTTSQEYILFRLDRLNGSTIIETASRIHGSAGPSALDVAAWYNMLQKHNEQSTRLANALAKTAIRISSSDMDPYSLRGLTTGRFIPFDKNPENTPCNSDWSNVLELSIRNRLLSKLIGLDNIDDDLREVIEISKQMEGLGIANPCRQIRRQYERSLTLCEPSKNISMAYRP